MKIYRLSIIVLLLLAIIVVFTTCGSKAKSVDDDNNDSFSFMNATVVDSLETGPFRPLFNIDVSSPLKKVSEQILYRKGYVVLKTRSYPTGLLGNLPPNM